MAATGIKISKLQKYPACFECNSILGDSLLRTIHRRKAFVLERLRRKYGGSRAAEWTDEEIDQLGPALGEYIKGHKRFAEYQRQRLDNAADLPIVNSPPTQPED